MLARLNPCLAPLVLPCMHGNLHPQNVLDGPVMRGWRAGSKEETCRSSMRGEYIKPPLVEFRMIAVLWMASS